MTSDGRLEELLIAIERNTREIADWLQLAYGDQTREKLESILSDDKKKLSYHNSDGERSTREVADLSGTSHTSVQRWWEEWGESRIVVEDPTTGRSKRRYDIVRLGISLPSVQSKKASQ